MCITCFFIYFVNSILSSTPFIYEFNYRFFTYHCDWDRKNDQNVLKYPPRKKDESLLNKKSLFRISFEGIVIGLCTMASYYCGLKINTLAASTFAFATICLSRLLHGLSSRNEKPIYQIGLFSNKQIILAFLIGTFLLHLVLYIPLLQKVFLIKKVSLFQMIPIYIFSLLSFFLIQVKKCFL